MAFTIYRSSDASAPAIEGTAGSLITALDAILVNGYGAKAAAGWTKEYSGVNKAAYRPPSGNRLYLRVQDDGPGAGTNKEARATGYETMSDVDTGTGPFPTAAQGPGGALAAMIWRKSASADGTDRTWLCAADARTMYLFVDPGDSAGYYNGYAFGELYSTLAGDAYNTFLIGRHAENNSSTTYEHFDKMVAFNTTNSGHFIARSYTGLGGSVLCGKRGNMWVDTGNIMAGIQTFPNPTDGGIYLSRIWFNESGAGPTYLMRGRMRGIWHFCHPIASVNTGDTFSGTGDLAGKTFLILKATANSGLVCIETSDTLETN